MLLGESANTSSGGSSPHAECSSYTYGALSDWIAHGLMDSIVDSFFPFLEVIEKEVLEIEHLVFSAGDTPADQEQESSPTVSVQRSSVTDVSLAPEKRDPELSEKISIDFAMASTKSIAPKPHFTSPTSIPLRVRRARRIVFEYISSLPRFKTIDTKSPNYHHPTTTIHRMARIRRLVTSLTRFLAVKSEVVAQVKKRLLTKGEWGLGTGTEDDLDVFVYMGDVQGAVLAWLGTRVSALTKAR